MEHHTESLRVGLPKPADRGAMECAHRAIMFMDAVTGTRADTQSRSSLKSRTANYLLQLCREKPTKQAPTMLVVLCGQNWSTLRFSDFGGLGSKDITVASSMFCRG